MPSPLDFDYSSIISLLVSVLLTAFIIWDKVIRGKAATLKAQGSYFDAIGESYRDLVMSQSERINNLERRLADAEKLYEDLRVKYDDLMQENSMLKRRLALLENGR